MDLESKDLVAERIEQMKALFPEIATEGDGSIDFEKLRLILGDEVDEGDERYAFTWPGKADAIRQSQTVSTATLRPCPEESVDWDTTQNLYIEGDNLEVLKLLQRGYHGKVKMIYIDPPYNTGKDFVYKDKFGDTIENYKQQSNLSGQSNADTSGRYHADWCSMIYPRLRLARELLTDDGVLVISIGHQEITNLIKICGEVFPDKQVAPVTIQTSGGKPSGGFNLLHEYLVFVVNEDFQPYAIEAFGGKSRSPFEGMTLSTFNKVQRPNQAYPIFIDPVSQTITGIGKSLAERLASGEVSNAGTFSYDYSEAPEGSVAVWPITAKGKECVWRLIPERVLRDWEKGYLKISPNRSAACPNEFSIQYLPEGVIQKVERGILEVIGKEDNGVTLIFGENQTVGSQIPSIWDSKEYHTAKSTAQLKELFNSDEAPFDYSKPLRLLEDVLGLITSNEDIILDFFAGSATTAHATMSLNAKDGGKRKWIMVQLPESCPDDSYARSIGFDTICEVSEQRLRLAGRSIAQTIEADNAAPRIGEEPKALPDVGFRVLELDDSGIVRPEPGQLLLERIKKDRTDQDVIFEMMLKWGLELTYPIEKTEVGGYPCYSVAADSLICCMQEGLSVQALQAIADLEPDRVLILDSILDDTLKLNALQIFKRAEERTQRQIDLRTV